MNIEYIEIRLDGQQGDDAISGEDNNLQDTMGEPMGSIETQVEVGSGVIQKPVVRDYSIPRKGNRLAIIRLELPVTSEDIAQVSNWLKLMANTITDEETKG